MVDSLLAKSVSSLPGATKAISSISLDAVDPDGGLCEVTQERPDGVGQLEPESLGSIGDLVVEDCYLDGQRILL